MSQPELPYEEAKEVVGILPSLEPHPNATNIRAMWINLVDKLTTMPSQQTADLGYSGMVQPVEIYALDTNVPWENLPDPGPHFIIDDTWDEDRKEKEELIFKANKKVFNNQQNVQCALIDALNVAVPRAYRRGTGANMGVKMYRPTDNPRDILNRLNDMYGRMTPQEKNQHGDPVERPLGAGRSR